MKKIIAIVLTFSVLFLVCVSPCALAQEIEPQKCGENVYYTINETEKTLTISGEGKMYNYKDVFGSPFALRQDISEVIIEEGVTSIGDNAFYCAYISKLTLPETLVSIGEGALSMTFIKKLNIPKNLIKIHDSNYFNFNLTTINVDPENPKFSSKDGVLFNKNKTTLLTYPMDKKGPYAIPSGVVTIGKEAFCDALRLRSVSFPNSVEVIEKSAFDSANLREITKYSKNLKHIGKNAFRTTLLKEYKITQNVEKISINAFASNERLKNFKVSKKNKAYSQRKGVIFSKDKKTLTVFPSGRKGKYILPKNTEKVGQYAFAYAYEMTEIVLNKNLKHIGRSAFTGMEIEKIVIPASVKSIGKSAFKYCEALKKIEFKGKIPKIRKGAFNKFYDDEIMTGKPNPKFYANNKTLAKGLKTKLKNSGLKSAKIYYKNDGKNINLKY